MYQALLAVFVWASFCIQTSLQSTGTRGCGVYGTIQSLPLPSQVKTVNISCEEEVNAQEQILIITLDFSSLKTGSTSLTEETRDLADIGLHTRFNTTVKIRPCNSTVEVLPGNKLHLDHTLRKRLYGVKETFKIVVTSNGSFYLSHASLEIITRRTAASTSSKMADTFDSAFGGCGFLATTRGRSLAVLSHLFPQVKSVSVNCTNKTNGDKQTLLIVVDTSLITGNGLPNETLVDVYLHITFSNPVEIRPVDPDVKVLSLAPDKAQEAQRDYILKKRLSEAKETFGINVTGIRGSFYISHSSLEINAQSSLTPLGVCLEKDGSDMLYIVGLAVTSTIAIISMVFCIVLFVKLRSQTSNSHQYAKPMPTTEKTSRPPAQILPIRSASEPKLTEGNSFTYDYAFVDGPPALQPAIQQLHFNSSDPNFQNGIPRKQPLKKTLSSSAPNLHSGESLTQGNTIKPKPPPKPGHLTMRKVSSAGQVVDGGYMHASPFNKHKPTPSPRKEIENKSNTIKSTTSEGYLRPVESFLIKKSTGNSATINRTLDREKGSNSYVPMEIKLSEVPDVQQYMPMGVSGLQ
jgi:hypothetical protein